MRWSEDLATFKTFESRIHLPAEFRPRTVPFIVERHIFENADGSLLNAAYSKMGPSTSQGLRASRRNSHLVRSTDGGSTWNHFATIGARGEPAVARLGEGRMTTLPADAVKLIIEVDADPVFALYRGDSGTLGRMPKGAFTGL